MYYGDLGQRVVAWAIDSMILSAISLIVVAIFEFTVVVLIPVVPVALFLYFVLMEGGSWHATPGKKIMGLYVADQNGRGITYSTAILRLIGKLLSSMTLYIGALIACFNKEKQCLHDMIAKTYVLTDTSRSSYYYGNKSVSLGYAGRPPQLVCVSGPLAGSVYPISKKGLIIGRDSLSCQVVLPASQGRISRVHCLVTYNPMSKMFVINDRNSTHGTYLANGSKVPHSQPVALKGGSKFYLASPQNIFEVR